jgi:osmotically inducible protein OsmC
MQKTGPSEILYTAEATAEDGGREGRVRTSDGRLDLRLSRPVEFRGRGGEGTNPEQLFATGYSACFASALARMGRETRRSTKGATVTARVGIGPLDERSFGLDVELEVRLPELEREEAEELVAMAHQVCPYSNALRSGLDVRVGVAD